MTPTGPKEAPGYLRRPGDRLAAVIIPSPTRDKAIVETRYYDPETCSLADDEFDDAL